MVIDKKLNKKEECYQYEIFLVDCVVIKKIDSYKSIIIEIDLNEGESAYELELSKEQCPEDTIDIGSRIKCYFDVVGKEVIGLNVDGRICLNMYVAPNFENSYLLLGCIFEFFLLGFFAGSIHHMSALFISIFMALFYPFILVLVKKSS